MACEIKSVRNFELIQELQGGYFSVFSLSGNDFELMTFFKNKKKNLFSSLLVFLMEFQCMQSLGVREVREEDLTSHL